jgi:hypothetical protein
MAAPLKSIPGRSTADCICDAKCTVKSCSQCYQVKPLCKFYFSSKKRNLRRANCKECSDKVSLSWTSRNKNRSDQNRIEYRKSPEVLAKRNSLEKERRIRNPQRNLFNRVKRRAKEQGIEFTLTLDDIVIPDVCPALGITLDLYSKDQDPWPTVDRINPKGSYSPDNFVVMSMRANRIKTDATLDELEKTLNFMIKARL